MYKIWKYPVAFDIIFHLEQFQLVMPTGAKILKLDIQRNEPQLWVVVNPENEVETRRFRVLGTGRPFEDLEYLEYVDSYQVNGGQFVWHVFEEKDYPYMVE